MNETVQKAKPILKIMKISKIEKQLREAKTENLKTVQQRLLFHFPMMKVK